MNRKRSSTICFDELSAHPTLLPSIPKRSKADGGPPVINHHQSSSHSSPSTLSQSDLVFQALSIVLQHLMMPDMLGWSSSELKDALPGLKDQLRHSLIDMVRPVFPRDEHHNNGELPTHEVHGYSLDDDFLHIHASRNILFKCHEKASKLFLLPVDAFYPKETVPRGNMLAEGDHDENGIYYLFKDFLETAKVLHNKYWDPISLLMQFQTTYSVIALREMYVALQMALCEYYKRQRDVYAARGYRGGVNLIIQQLHNFQRWQLLIENVVEKELFSLSLIPPMLQVQRKRCHESYCGAKVLFSDPLPENYDQVTVSQRQLNELIQHMRNTISSKLVSRPNKSDISFSLDSSMQQAILHLKAIAYNVLHLTNSLFSSAHPPFHRTQMIVNQANPQFLQSKFALRGYIDLFDDFKNYIYEWMGERQPCRFYDYAKIECHKTHPINLSMEAQWLSHVNRDLAFLLRNKSSSLTVTEEELLEAYQHFDRAFCTMNEALRFNEVTTPIHTLLTTSCNLTPKLIEGLPLTPRAKQLVFSAYFVVQKAVECFTLRRQLRLNDERFLSAVPLVYEYISMCEDFTFTAYDCIHECIRGEHFAEVNDPIEVNVGEDVLSLLKIAILGIEAKFEVIKALIGQPSLSLSKVIYQLPIMRHFCEMRQDRDIAHADQSIRCFQDGLSTYCYSCLLVDLDEVKDEVLALRVESVNCMQSSAATLNSTIDINGSTTVPDFVFYETCAQLYQRFSDMLEFYTQREAYGHSCASDCRKDILEWGSKLKETIKAWQGLEGDSSMEIIFLRRFLQCKISHIEVGISSFAMLYENFLSGHENDCDCMESSPCIKEIRKMWKHLKPQLCLLQQRIGLIDEDANLSCGERMMRVHNMFASLSPCEKLYLEETMFWMERALTITILFSNTYAYTNNRIFDMDRSSLEMYDRYFKDVLPVALEYCQKFDLANIDSLSKSSPATMEENNADDRINHSVANSMMNLLVVSSEDSNAMLEYKAVKLQVSDNVLSQIASQVHHDYEVQYALQLTQDANKDEVE